jgi:trehalose/maltose hydrolase-like predicted phosphorylase
MDGPLFAAISAPIADALLQYRLARLPAAKSIAAMNGYSGAYWPWQSAVTGFERSCGNVSIVQKVRDVVRLRWLSGKSRKLLFCVLACVRM